MARFVCMEWLAALCADHQTVNTNSMKCPRAAENTFAMNANAKRTMPTLRGDGYAANAAGEPPAAGE